MSTRPRLTLAQARLQLQLGPTDPRVRPRYEPQQADLENTVPTTVAIGVGTHTAEGLKMAAYDKRTGEWKARLWGGRKEIVAPDGTTLHDHHLGKNGEPLGRRKQESNWFLTVNTNKRKFERTPTLRTPSGRTPWWSTCLCLGASSAGRSLAPCTRTCTCASCTGRRCTSTCLRCSWRSRRSTTAAPCP